MTVFALLLFAQTLPVVEDVPAAPFRAHVEKMLKDTPEAFTPDGEFCLGETEVDGLFVAAGFCAHGLAGAGGIGVEALVGTQNGARTLTIRDSQHEYVYTEVR